MWMKFVDEDCGEEKAVSLNATECYGNFGFKASDQKFNI